jgi:hypothetical protein
MKSPGSALNGRGSRPVYPSHNMAAPGVERTFGTVQVAGNLKSTLETWKSSFGNLKIITNNPRKTTTWVSNNWA